MRVTQVEIQTKAGDTRVYWLDDDPYNDRGLAEGQRVMLAEEGIATYWTIKRKMVSVSDEMKPWLVANLKARMGTILELLSA
jgi:hypothetical protein